MTVIVVHGAVPANSVYGSSKDRYYTILMSGESPEHVTYKNTSRISVWFEKILGG